MTTPTNSHKTWTDEGGHVTRVRLPPQPWWGSRTEAVGAVPIGSVLAPLGP